MAKADVSAQRVRELLEYDAQTGVFKWRPGRRGAPKTREPGCMSADGYRLITVDARLLMAHRLAWLYVHGEWPKGVIDHINGDKRDNRIANLRDATLTMNRQNLRNVRTGARSGFLGVVWDAERQKWQAQIYVAKKRTTLGRFDDPEEAHNAYVEAKRRLHQGCTI